MDNTFKDYLKQARKDFAKVAVKYSTTNHLELRTAIDSLLIAYDQAVDKALTIPIVIKCDHDFKHIMQGSTGVVFKCRKCGGIR